MVKPLPRKCLSVLVWNSELAHSSAFLCKMRVTGSKTRKSGWYSSPGGAHALSSTLLVTPVKKQTGKQ